MKALVESKILDQFLCGDAIDVARRLPDDCIDTVVTSPPYYQQRYYGSKDQIGQEVSPAAYVERLTELFVELKRVVRPTGSVWMSSVTNTVTGSCWECHGVFAWRSRTPVGY